MVPCFMPYPQFYLFTPIGINTLTLDAAEEHIAFVIQAPKTGTIKKIGWMVTASSSPVGITCYVALETVADAVGVPVATSRAGATLYAAGAESAAISNPTTGVRFDAINGTTGISVTRGDLIAVTIRCTARTSGSFGVGYDQNGMFGGPMGMGSYYSYTYGYTGSGSTYYAPVITLEYDGEFVVVPWTIPVMSTSLTAVDYNSGSNPDRRGLAFTFPDFSCTASGVVLTLDQDSDCDLILYDSDEYSVMTGFPITLDKDKRKGTSRISFYVRFPNDVTFTQDQWYRLVVLPKAASPDVSILTYVPADDGTILGMNAYVEGLNVKYTTFNGTPTSGSHAWTDDTTKRVLISMIINQIDIPVPAGGLPILGGSIVR
jgi:hypothetical protein